VGSPSLGVWGVLADDSETQVLPNEQKDQ